MVLYVGIFQACVTSFYSSCAIDPFRLWWGSCSLLRVTQSFVFCLLVFYLFCHMSLNVPLESFCSLFNCIDYYRISIFTVCLKGTTWMQEIVWLILSDGDFERASKQQVYFRSPFLEFKDDILNEVGLDLANPMPSPRVIKTHLPVKLAPTQLCQKECKVRKY